MFQWICPECGQEIDPRVQECSACTETLPAKTSSVESETPDLASRWVLSSIDPKPTFSGEESPSLDTLWTGPALLNVQTTFPKQSSFPASNADLAPPLDYRAWVQARTQPAAGRIRSGLAPSAEELTLLPPTLPGKPAPLKALELDRPSVPLPATLPQPERSSNWILSMAVAAGMLGFMAVAAIYAMPTLARSGVSKRESELKLIPEMASVESSTKAAEDPLARVIEIAGVRFVTDIPGKRPEIHYLVVNHSGRPVSEVTASVTLTLEDDLAPISQFSFRTPRLDSYESKEMISSLDPLKQPVPQDWRHTRVEISLKR